MKKWLCILLTSIWLVTLSGCGFDEMAYFYSSVDDWDGFHIAINTVADCAFVGRYACEDITRDRSVVIPDEVDGIPVTRIGGYYGRGVPTPFDIVLPDDILNAPEGSEFYGAVFSDELEEWEFSQEYTVEDIKFDLYIGKNIEVAEYIRMGDYYPHIQEDGNVVFYHPVVYIHCAQENAHFYAQDGKLYDKKTRELVSDFVYAVS